MEKQCAAVVHGMECAASVDGPLPGYKNGCTGGSCGPMAWVIDRTYSVRNAYVPACMAVSSMTLVSLPITGSGAFLSEPFFFFGLDTIGDLGCATTFVACSSWVSRMTANGGTK